MLRYDCSNVLVLGTLVESEQFAKQTKEVFTQLVFKKVFAEVK